jgi:hypothetical protein
MVQKSIANTPNPHSLYYVSFEDYLKLKKLVMICFRNEKLLSNYIYFHIIFHEDLFQFPKKVFHLFIQKVYETNIFLKLQLSQCDNFTFH